MRPAWAGAIRSRRSLRFIRPWRRQLALTVVLRRRRGWPRSSAWACSARSSSPAVKGGGWPQALIIALLVVAPLAGLLHWLESWLAHDMAYRLLAEMRIDLFAKLEALAPAYLLERRSGDLLALSTQDVETVEYFYAHTVAPAFVAVLVPCAVLAMLAATAWPLALALLPFLAYAGLSPLLRPAAHRRAGLASARRARASSARTSPRRYRGSPSCSLSRRRRSAAREFMALVRRYQQMRLALLDDLARQSGAAGARDRAWAASRSRCVGAYRGGERRGSPPTLLPLLILISVAAFLPVSEIAQVGRQLADTIASTRRLHVVHSRTGARSPTAALDAPVRGAAAWLQFERVRFTYPRRSASPRSSDVIVRGRRGIDRGAGRAFRRGQDDDREPAAAFLGSRTKDRSAWPASTCRALTLDGLRQRIALVAQDTYLFNDTLEANIRLARPDASQAEIASALEQAALAEFVAGLPDGLETRVGERGVQLSGGQRQRIAIARAFLKDAPILVLDEATSHLDTLSEEQVRAALDCADGRSHDDRDRASPVDDPRGRPASWCSTRAASSKAARTPNCSRDAALYARLIERQMRSVAQAYA